METDISDYISFLGENIIEYPIIEYPTIQEIPLEECEIVPEQNISLREFPTIPKQDIPLKEKPAIQERDNESTSSISKSKFPIDKLFINKSEQFEIVEKISSKERKKVSNDQKSILKKKRGRKNKNENPNRKSHGRNDPCNIRSLIAKKYFVFIISFVNAIIHQILIDDEEVQQYKLKKIKYNDTISIENIKKLKEKTIKEIVSYGPNGKYKVVKENENKEICEKIIQKSVKISKIMNLKYMDLFEIFSGENKIVNMSKYGVDIQVILNSEIMLYKDVIAKIKKKENNSKDLDEYLNKMNECKNDYKKI
jgi:hypothetical protein